MTEPPPVVPQHRNPVGWMILIAILVMLILLNLATYFDRPHNFKLALERTEATLKTTTKLKTGVSLAETPVSTDKLVKDLEPFAAEEKEARLALMVLRREGKQPQVMQEVNTFKLSKDPRERAYYGVYSVDKLSKEDAGRAKAKIGEARFSDKLAGIHALEAAAVPDARAELGRDGIGSAALVMGLLAVLALGIGFLLLITFAAMRLTGTLTPQGFALEELSKPDADRLALRDSHYFAIFLLLPWLLRPLAAMSPFKPAIEIFYYCLIVGAIIWLAKIPVEGRYFTLRKLGISREKLGRNILWGVGGAVANIPIVIAMGLLGATLFKNLPGAEHPLTNELEAGGFFTILKAFLTAAVAAPFIEEVMFRGTMFPAMSAVLRSPIAGALLSSFFFGAIHPTGIPAWPALMSIGLVSCVLAYQTKSLVPSIVMHAVHNSLTLIFTLVMFNR